MVAFNKRMPTAIPGAVNRSNQSTIEAQFQLSTAPFLAYGLPAVIDVATGKARPVIAGDTAASVYGVILRPFPATGNGIDGLGVSTPSNAGTANILKRGYVGAQVNGATASTKNGTVYVRVGGAAAGKPIGGFEAALDATAGNTVALPPNCYFMGISDSVGLTEIAFNI